MQSETAPASHPDFPSHLPLIHHNISFLLHRYGLGEDVVPVGALLLAALGQASSK